MKVFYSFFLILLLLNSCGKIENLEPTKNLFGQKYENGLRIKGHEFDSLIVENCIFENKPVLVYGADDIIFRNCTFKNIKKNGIQIGFSGNVNRLTIENCTFKEIGYNAIDSGEDAYKCIIKNCHFENVALSEIGDAMGQPHHAIYWKGPEVLIEHNTFISGSQNKGNAISFRSSGIIRSNTIINAPKNGIQYYTDHPGGDSVLIENNFIYNSRFHAIGLTSNGNQSNHSKKAIISFNSCYQSEGAVLYASKEFENNMTVTISGNVLISPTNEFIKTFYQIHEEIYNLKAIDDIGFVDLENGDLHLTSNSEAINFCNGLVNFPNTDIDGDQRTSNNLDAGADEVN